jgi:hypothetical protein
VGAKRRLLASALENIQDRLLSLDVSLDKIFNLLLDPEDEAFRKLRVPGLRGGERDPVVPVCGVGEADKPAAAGRGAGGGPDPSEGVSWVGLPGEIRSIPDKTEQECDQCAALTTDLDGGWCRGCAKLLDDDLHESGEKCLSKKCEKCDKKFRVDSKTPPLLDWQDGCQECQNGTHYWDCGVI